MGEGEGGLLIPNTAFYKVYPYHCKVTDLSIYSGVHELFSYLNICERKKKSTALFTLPYSKWNFNRHEH